MPADVLRLFVFARHAESWPTPPTCSTAIRPSLSRSPLAAAEDLAHAASGSPPRDARENELEIR